MSRAYLSAASATPEAKTLDTTLFVGPQEETKLEALAPGTRLSVSCGLTLAGGFTRSDAVSAWRQRPQTLPDRLPAVFALLAA